MRYCGGGCLAARHQIMWRTGAKDIQYDGDGGGGACCYSTELGSWYLSDDDARQSNLPISGSDTDR